MGVVFRAMDKVTGAPVALKVLRLEDISPADIDRFMREAEILATLRHPNVVEYVGHGEAEGGRPFLAMEWLDGHDLGTYLEKSSLSPEDAVTLLRKVAEALGVAHSRGIVHRDIKPNNIFLRNGGIDRPALLDFGIARRLRATRQITQTGVLLGTPSYMSPEQISGEQNVDPAADVFALGCVLYECLAGKPPFVGTNIAAVLAKILFQPVPPLRAMRPEVPEALEALVERMLAKDPTERFAEGNAVLDALDRLNFARSRSSAGHSTTPPLASALTASERRIFSVVLAVSTANNEDIARQATASSGLHTSLA